MELHVDLPALRETERRIADVIRLLETTAVTEFGDTGEDVAAALATFRAGWDSDRRTTVARLGSCVSALQLAQRTYERTECRLGTAAGAAP